MRIEPTIFKAYDIRGKYPAEINEFVAQRLGEALTAFFSKKNHKKKLKILVCRDVRNSSQPLKEALINGIISCGSDVWDAGTGTTPFFYFLMHTLKFDGGIMITASHNPPEYNGFKIRGRGGIPIFSGNGLEVIRNLVKRKPLLFDSMGMVTTAADYREKYIHFLAKNASIKRIKTVVDAGGGSTTFFLPELLNKFPKITYKPLFFEPDGAFKKHSPSPYLPASQKPIKEELKKGGYSFGAIFDGDGDRVIFFDEKGEMVRSEYILGIFVSEELKDKETNTFVLPVNTSRSVREYLKERGGKVVLSRVGNTFMHMAMRRARASLGAEMSGHFYFQKFFYADSGLFAWLKLAAILSKNPRPLSQLIKPFKRYIFSGEINFNIKDGRTVIKKVERKYQGEKISRLDGITVEFPDWWFNIRPSNTEPIVRLVLEAKTKELFDEKLIQVEKLIKG